MIKYISAVLAAVLTFTAAFEALAHPERTKLPKTVSEAFIPMTSTEERKAPNHRHPPGNVRAENMHELFGNGVMIVDSTRKGISGAEKKPHHALKIIFIGRNGRYHWCADDKDFNYFYANHPWAPTKVAHDGTKSPRFDPNISNDKHSGLSPLYDGKTGRTIWYDHSGPRKTWIDRDVGHLQERLPRAVWTLCPDFPSAEELGVGVNEKQTAVTYDRLLEQDPGRRVLRPDLITTDPTEVIE